MEPKFNELRACIYTTQAELNRFRKIVVNTVMATDIMDKTLLKSRKERWEKAFASSPPMKKKNSRHIDEAKNNLRATIVIEHLIQASDVAHMMQHWHVYIKWNERLFHEVKKSYKLGRIKKDPSANWYEGELKFFDYVIIPLAKKLKECGAFGVASDEYLSYAEANRHEWEIKGRGIVAMYETEGSSTSCDEEGGFAIADSSRTFSSATAEEC